MHGGVAKSDLAKENPEAIKTGLSNLIHHVDNVRRIYVPYVVAINRFSADTDEEIKFLKEQCNNCGVNVVVCDSWAEGGRGAENLAKEVVRLCDEDSSDFTYWYRAEDSIEKKIKTVVEDVYHGSDVNILPSAKRQIEKLEKLGFGNLPICIAKTQYSFSDNPMLLNAPTGFTVTIKNVKVCAGAGFIVVLTGDIMTMPGLPKHPAAENINIDEDGKIIGLF